MNACSFSGAVIPVKAKQAIDFILVQDPTRRRPRFIIIFGRCLSAPGHSLPFGRHGLLIFFAFGPLFVIMGIQGIRELRSGTTPEQGE